MKPLDALYLGSLSRHELVKIIRSQERKIEKHMDFITYCKDISLDKRVATYADELLKENES